MTDEREAFADERERFASAPISNNLSQDCKAAEPGSTQQAQTSYFP
jgi:hypothetical protein